MKSIQQISSRLVPFIAAFLLSMAGVYGCSDNSNPISNDGEREFELVDFQPDSAYVGQSIEISGIGFSKWQARYIHLSFGGVETTADSVELTSGYNSGKIYVTVPDSAESGPIQARLSKNTGGTKAKTLQSFKIRPPFESNIPPMYWTASASEGEIIGTSYINDVGTKVNKVLYNPRSGTEAIEEGSQAVAVDLNTNMIYFSNTSNGYIGRVPMDGNGQVEILYNVEEGDPVQYVPFVALDAESGSLYWSGIDGTVRGSMEGRDDEPAEVLYPSGQDGYPEFGGTGVDIQLDTQNGYIYWTEYGDSEIVRGSLDGSTPMEIIYQPSDASPALVDTRDLEIDPENNRLFVLDGTGDWDDHRILSGPADGSGQLSTLYEGNEQFTYDAKIEYDAQQNYLYWAPGSGEEYGHVLVQGRPDGSTEPEVIYDLSVDLDYNGQIYAMNDLALLPSGTEKMVKSRSYAEGEKNPPIYIELK